MEWNAPAAPGGDPGQLRYDTLRSGAPNAFPLCLESNDGPNTNATDAANPSSGQAFFYLNRARNACPNGVGSLGTRSDGVERTGAACP